MDWSVIPAEDPPPGVKPNFVDPPDTLYAAEMTTFVLCVTLTTAFTAARIAAKLSVSRLMLEDWMLLLAWSLNIAYDGLFLAQAQAGIGKHMWDLYVPQVVPIARMNWATELLYCPANLVAKTALLLQLRRTFAPQKVGLMYQVIQALLWGNLALYVSCFIAFLLQCSPGNLVWTQFVPTTLCTDLRDALIATGAFNVFSDLLILVLPTWGILHLQMASKRKIGIIAVFATGTLAFIASVCRLVYSITILSGYDSTHATSKIIMWSLAELATIILCTCFPMMPRFVQLIRGKTAASKATSMSGDARHRSEYGKASRLSVQRKKIPLEGNRVVCHDCSLGLPCEVHQGVSEVSVSHSNAADNTRERPANSHTGGNRYPVSIELMAPKAAREWV